MEIHLKAGMKVIIEAMQVSLKGAGGFVDIGPAGVAIQGTMVLINSGGAAGSGSGASPDAPKAPHEADDGPCFTKKG
jgi:type VI secretion system secreted protein VgrG